MSEIRWRQDRIEVDPPTKPKKITATRFASILGLNPWCSPFEAWCEITRTWQKPFEDTPYTLAGKAIEPSQIDYMRKAYAMTDLRTPTDVFGKDYFRKTRGDFFPRVHALGGMWDAILVDEGGRPRAVIEFKTTKRSEDWLHDVPEYYALQAALYAYLLGVEDVIMVCSFLEEKDYEHPERYVPHAGNTITRPFRLHDRYPDFGEKADMALDWWEEHVETGLSPCYSEKQDKEVLKALRTHEVKDDDLDALIAEGEGLKKEVDLARAGLEAKEKRLDEIGKILKDAAISRFREGDKAVVFRGKGYAWTLTKTPVTTIDKARLAADGLLEKYQKTDDQYRMRVTGIGGE